MCNYRMAMLTTRDQELVLARDRGDTTVALGEKFGISHQRVSVVMARATEFVNHVDLDLMVARKTGEVCAYVIPYGPDYTLARRPRLDVARR
jgi:transcriptional regulator